MPPVGFKPAVPESKLMHNPALDRLVTTGDIEYCYGYMKLRGFAIILSLYREDISTVDGV